MTQAHGSKQFGEGPLSVLASFIYTAIAVNIMLVVASMPSIVVLYFLAQDGSNLPLAALSAIPVGPALSAAIYALHHRRRDLTELRPVRQFWHGYALNWRAVMPVWTIGMVWLGIVGVTLANFWVSGLPAWWAVLLGLIGLLAILWLTNALVVTSLFEFRTRDVLRLAWELIPRRPLVAVGDVGVVSLAVVLAVYTSDLLVMSFGVVFVLLLVAVNRPLVALVTEEFTATAPPS